MRLKISVTLLLSMVLLMTNAQLSEKKGYPVIGERCPSFLFSDVKYHSKNKISLEDIKGKHVILDFWAKDCISCIASFPKWDKIQKEFNDKLLVVLVGMYDSQFNKSIKDIYEKYRKKFNLDLAVAFDSAMFMPPFKMIGGVPWYVWIDEQGIVKAVTGPSAITKQNIEAFLSGSTFAFSDASYDTYKATKLYDFKKPLLFQSNGGKEDTAFLYRSLLTTWQPGMPTWNGMDIDHFFTIKGFNLPKYEVSQLRLKELFITAYTGKAVLPDDFYSQPILSEEVDSMLFKEDLATGAGFYCYSLMVPKSRANASSLMKIMQNDLDSYFGHKASVIEKEMPCLILKVIDNEKFEKIKNKEGKKFSNSNGADHYYASNLSLDVVAKSLKGYSSKYYLRIFNETGFNGKVDLKLNALIVDFEEMRSAINKIGLDIIEGRHKMKVLEITNSVMFK